ncbi:DUF6146 family protein [Flavobacterium sp.]|uniref:DUF6146 family protein n=1 Tax=Flavobacterium sp. TaxID=239 RepID=UPI0037502ABF
MKKLCYLIVILFIIISCNTNKNLVLDNKKDAETKKFSDTVRIANDELEYEVIIFEPGFNYWLNSTARPRGFYTESFLEGRNRIYVAEWNNRVMQPQLYNTQLYEMQINYLPSIHYGYEVNYLIYNYFIFFQINYKQQLAGFVPRI